MAEYNPSKIIKDGNTYNFRDTTKIPLAGSNAISGDLIPSTDNSIDIGSSTNNIKMLYTKGITIDGTQFLPSDYATLSSLSTVATSGSYNDLSNKPTIPTVNNATLTIQKNGTNVQTFTANQSTNATANITVPTKTSDLTNDSGFITSDNTKIPLTGSNQISGDLIPSTDGTVNLGSSSYQWNNAYIKSLTINGVACGDILTHNASEFVDVSSNQTIGGRKIFSDASTGLGKDIYLFATIPYGKNTPPATASTQYINFSGNTASQGFENGWVSGYIEQTVQTNGGSRCRWLIRNTDEKYAAVELLSAGNTFAFRPSVNNTMLLGLVSHAWKDCNTKAINGINPGALSLPSTLLSAMIRIDTTSWVLDGETDIEYTPLGNGHLTLANNQNLEWAKGQITNDNNFGIYRFTYKYDSVLGGIQGFTIPCIKDKKVIMKIKGTGFYNALFIYCQGNV